MRRLDRFMTEPQHNHEAVDAGLQEFHRSAVPRHSCSWLEGQSAATQIDA
jgi:hypothetical protein